MKFLPILFIRLYQKVISPYIPARCRFYPSCSQYSLECFYQFSIPRALWYSLRRIVRCHPFSAGGYDPVPKNERKIHE